MGISPQLLHFPYGHWCLPWVIFLMFTTQFNGLEMSSSNWGEKAAKVVADCCKYFSAGTHSWHTQYLEALSVFCFDVNVFLISKVFWEKRFFCSLKKARLLVLPLFVSVSIALFSTTSHEMLWASLVLRIHRWSPHSSTWFLQWNLFSLAFLLSGFCLFVCFLICFVYLGFCGFFFFFFIWKFSFFTSLEYLFFNSE